MGQREIRKYLEMNNNETQYTKTYWMEQKVPRGQFTEVNAYFKKEISEVKCNNLF